MLYRLLPGVVIRPVFAIVCLSLASCHNAGDPSKAESLTEIMQPGLVERIVTGRKFSYWTSSEDGTRIRASTTFLHDGTFTAFGRDTRVGRYKFVGSRVCLTDTGGDSYCYSLFYKVSKRVYLIGYHAKRQLVVLE